MSPQDYCQQKAQQAGSSFTAAFRLLPPDRRSAMEALYAFCREVDDIADECTDPTVAAIKLAWWRQEVDKVFAAESQHPVGLALAGPCKTYQLQRSDLLAVIEGVSSDLNPLPFADFAMLDAYCDQVAGAVGRLSARVFGPTDEPTLAYATELGLALQYTNILRDVGDDARHGRVYLPDGLLAQHGLNRRDVLSRKDTPALRAVLARLAELAHGRYDQALALLPARRRADQRPGLVMAAIYRDLLRAIQESDYAVLHQRISLGPARKLWVAGWAAAGQLPR